MQEADYVLAEYHRLKLRDRSASSAFFAANVILALSVASYWVSGEFIHSVLSSATMILFVQVVTSVVGGGFMLMALSKHLSGRPDLLWGNLTCGVVLLASGAVVPHVPVESLNVLQDSIESVLTVGQGSALAVGLLLLFYSARIHMAHKTYLTRKDMEALGDTKTRLGTMSTPTKDKKKSSGSDRDVANNSSSSSSSGYDGVCGSNSRRSSSSSGGGVGSNSSSSNRYSSSSSSSNSTNKSASSSFAWPSLYSPGDSTVSQEPYTYTRPERYAPATSPGADTYGYSSPYGGQDNSTLLQETLGSGGAGSAGYGGGNSSSRRSSSRSPQSLGVNSGDYDLGLRADYFASGVQGGGGRLGRSPLMGSPGTSALNDSRASMYGGSSNSSVSLSLSMSPMAGNMGAHKVEWTEPRWRPYSSSPQNDEQIRSRLATGSMKHVVRELFQDGRPSRLDNDMDELRRGLHLYIRGVLTKFDTKVDDMVVSIQQQTNHMGDAAEQKRLLRLDLSDQGSDYGSPSNASASYVVGNRGRFSGGGSGSSDLDAARQRASGLCPHLFQQYERLISLFTLRAVTADRVNTRLVAARIRALVPATDSHLGGMSYTSSAKGDSRGSRRGGGVPFKAVTDAEIVMNSFFHLCDSGVGDENFSSSHFAEDVKAAKDNLQNPYSCKAGIVMRPNTRSGQGAAPSYAMYYQDPSDFSFVEVHVPEGGKNCLYAIYALLRHFNNRNSVGGQMIPAGLAKLKRDVFRN